MDSQAKNSKSTDTDSEKESQAHEETVTQDEAGTARELELAAANLKIKDKMIESLRSEIRGYESKIAELREFTKKMEAEVAAIRERSQRDLQKQTQQAKISFFERILPVLDNLQLSLKSVKADDPFVQGVRFVASDFEKQLQAEGLEKISSQGEVFDPQWHEAIGTIPVQNDEQDDRIVEECKSGYRLGDQIVRTAQVLVGKKTSE